MMLYYEVVPALMWSRIPSKTMIASDVMSVGYLTKPKKNSPILCTNKEDFVLFREKRLMIIAMLLSQRKFGLLMTSQNKVREKHSKRLCNSSNGDQILKEEFLLEPSIKLEEEQDSSLGLDENCRDFESFKGNLMPSEDEALKSVFKKRRKAVDIKAKTCKVCLASHANQKVAEKCQRKTSNLHESR